MKNSLNIPYTLPAGLPLFIGGISTIIGDLFIAGKIVIVEFSILFLISGYDLIKKNI